jgi:mono/diheme cytochrome c family protein
MTEVPEYLLQRSRERRAALGLAPAEGDAGPAAEGEAPAAPPAAAEGAGAGTSPPAAAPAGSVAVAERAAPPAAATGGIEPAALTAYLETEARTRTGVPVWMIPVLALLPIWAFAYLGALSPPSKGAAALTPLQLGSQVFAKNCSPCHGATGGGGVGPKLAGGEAKLTFPTEADHIAWVETGSAAKKGQKYGDPNRPGGQHGPATGGMPPFKGTLTDAQIKAVVTFERDGLK